MCLWECFRMRPTFELAGQGKQTALPVKLGWASSSQWKAWIEQNGWHCQVGEISSPLTAFELRLWSFTAFRLGLGLELTSLDLVVLGPSDSGWNYAISCPGSPACWLQNLRLLSLHNCVSHFLNNKYLFI